MYLKCIQHVTTFHAVLFFCLFHERCVSCLLSATTEKRKDSSESSTWALSNFLKEVNQSKENTSANKNCSGEVCRWVNFLLVCNCQSINAVNVCFCIIIIIIVVIIIVIIVRLAPFQCLASLLPITFRVACPVPALWLTSYTLRLWNDRSFFIVASQEVWGLVANQEVWGHPANLFQSLWGTVCIQVYKFGILGFVCWYLSTCIEFDVQNLLPMHYHH